MKLENDFADLDNKDDEDEKTLEADWKYSGLIGNGQLINSQENDTFD